MGSPVTQQVDQLEPNPTHGSRLSQPDPPKAWLGLVGLVLAGGYYVSNSDEAADNQLVTVSNCYSPFYLFA